MNRITFVTFVCIALGACFHQDAEEDSRFTWAAEPCELAHTVYEVDRIITPRTPNEAEQLGFNLDHDRYHRVDNAAGILLANLHQQGLGDGAVREFDPVHDAWFVHVARCVDERVDDYVRASVSLSRRHARAGAPFPAVGYAERNRLFVGAAPGWCP